MGTRDAICTVIAYEAYFITKLGMELKDDKWLRKHPIVFDADPITLYEQFLKVFRRVTKKYLTSLGVESVSISITKDYLKLIIKHPAVVTWFLQGKPRPRFTELRHSVRTRGRRSYSFTSYGSAWPREKAALNILLPRPPHARPVNSPEYRFNEELPHYSAVLKLGEIFKTMLKYHEEEQKAFQEDLEYIKHGDTEDIANQFSYEEVSNFQAIGALVDKVYPESKVERLTNLLYKHMMGGN